MPATSQLGNFINELPATPLSAGKRQEASKSPGESLCQKDCRHNAPKILMVKAKVQCPWWLASPVIPITPRLNPLLPTSEIAGFRIPEPGDNFDASPKTEVLDMGFGPVYIEGHLLLYSRLVFAQQQSIMRFKLGYLLKSVNR